MKVLVICPYFSPENVIGAVRISKLVKYLVRYDHDITVISAELNDYNKIDNYLECDEFNRIRRIKVPYSIITKKVTCIYKKNRTGTSSYSQNKQSLRSLLSSVVRQSFVYYRDADWAQNVIREIRRCNEHFDIIFSSSPLLASHRAACYAKKKCIAGKWIADFRDLIPHESDKGLRLALRTIQQESIIKDADAVTVVTDEMKRILLRGRKKEKRIFCINNGFDEEDLLGMPVNIESNELKSNRLVFSCTGNLYGGERDLTPFFRACAELVGEGSVPKAELLLVYAGNDGLVLKKQAEEHNMQYMVRDEGYVTRERSLAIQRMSACSIIATFCFVDGAGAMTGKIYEPLMLRKPIIMLVSGKGRNSEPAAFAKKIKAEAIYEESIDGNDISGIKKAILHLYENKKHGRESKSDTDELMRDRYSYEHLVSELNSVFEDVVKEVE